MENITAPYAPPKIVAEAVLAHLASQHSSGTLSLYLENEPRVIQRPWSTIYFLTVINLGERRELVAKIAHFPDQTIPGISWQSEELLIRGQREFDTITRVYNHFAQQPNPLLSAVRSQAYLPEINAIVMDFVSGTPLYDECIAIPCLLTARGRRRAEQMMRNAGQWLRWFHQMPLGDPPAEHVFGPFDTFQDLLKTVNDLCALGTDPTTLPLWNQTLAILGQVSQDQRVWTHGDFHLRNVLVLPNKSVLGFDTAMERVDSPYADLGKFVADLKTRRAMVLSLGLLPSPAVIRDLTRAFLSGYLAGEKLATLPLALYEGFFIFEKWVESLEKIRNTFSGSAALLGSSLRNIVVNPTFQRIVNRWMYTINAATAS